MKLEEKKKLEEILIKIASLHNPRIPPDIIKEHVARHVDIVDKNIAKYGAITGESVKDLRYSLTRFHRLKTPLSPLSPYYDWSDEMLSRQMARSAVWSDERLSDEMLSRQMVSRILSRPMAMVESAIWSDESLTKKDIVKELNEIMAVPRKDATKSLCYASLQRVTRAMHTERKTVETKESAANSSIMVPYKPYTQTSTVNNISCGTLI